MNYNIKINNIAAKYLNDLLQSTDWTRTTSDIILAGKVLTEKLPQALDKEAKAVAGDVEKFEAWADRLVTFDLTEKEREVCRFAVEKFAKSGRVPPNKYGAALVQALGFEE